MTRTLLLLALAAVIGLASGCSRNQTAWPVSTPSSPTTNQSSGLEQPPDPTAALNGPVGGLQPEGEGSPALASATAAAEDSLASATQTNPAPSRYIRPLSDLVYLTEDSLMRWNALTGTTSTLAENVIDFAASQDRQVIVLLRPQKITANGIQHFVIDALNLPDLQIITLVENAETIEKFTVSPNGSYVAFTQKGEDGDQIFVSPVEPGSQPDLLGTCQPQPTGDCASLAWSPDSRDLMWSDVSGLWQSPVNAEEISQKAQLVHPDTLQVIDPKGQSIEIQARFSDLQFAPSERFVLVKVAPLNSTVGWQAVFDRRSGLLAQAPDTFVSGDVETLVKWQVNGDLLVGHASEPNRSVAPFIHIWHVIPTNPELLVSGEQYNLYSDDFPFSTAQSKSIPAHCVNWLAEAQPDHLLFAIRLNQSDDPPVLFDLNLVNGSLSKLQTLPDDITQVQWSPDGNHALVIGGRNQIYLFSYKSGELTDLQPTIGSGARQFLWLAPLISK